MFSKLKRLDAPHEWQNLCRCNRWIYSERLVRGDFLKRRTSSLFMCTAYIGRIHSLYSLNPFIGF